jgi:predicted DNA-binding transcriptional regulator AlpA
MNKPISDGDFPQRIQLGANSVGWYEDEIDAWVASRKRGSLPDQLATVEA